MSNIDKINRHIGKHLDAFEDELDEVLVELFTKSTRDSDAYINGLIEHWEEDFGITDPAASLAGRQNELNAKVRAVGGDDFDYFTNIASGLGYNIDSGTDPHIRITDGDFPPAKADYAQADISQIWDQDAGNSFNTWCVRGTNVESDNILKDIFENQKSIGTEVIFINE